MLNNEMDLTERVFWGRGYLVGVSVGSLVGMAAGIGLGWVLWG